MITHLTTQMLNLIIILHFPYLKKKKTQLKYTLKIFWGFNHDQATSNLAERNEFQELHKMKDFDTQKGVRTRKLY